MAKKFRRFIPHLIVMLASILAYFFYDSRTHKPQTSENQQNQVEPKTSEVQTQKNKNCNPSQELLTGKKYANAGCLIIQNGKILVISRKDKKHRKKHEEKTHKSTEKPSEQKIKSAIPGGRKNQDELSPCTAERKTLELTGIEVVATKKLFTAKNGFTVFLCESKTQIPQSQKFHGSEISFAYPSKITNYKYPEQLEEIKKYLQSN
jgi:hypothetical protein